MTDDPMESLIRQTLLRTGVRFVEGDTNDAHLDFYLTDFELYIEVKQFHSDRIAVQMARAENVIVAQGRKAVEALAALIEVGAMDRLRSRSLAGLGTPQAAGADLNFEADDWPSHGPGRVVR